MKLPIMILETVKNINTRQNSAIFSSDLIKQYEESLTHLRATKNSMLKTITQINKNDFNHKQEIYNVLENMHHNVALIISQLNIISAIINQAEHSFQSSKNNQKLQP